MVRGGSPLSSFRGKRHLATIVPQEENNGGENHHHDEIDGMTLITFCRETPPKDEDDFQDEKKNGKFDLSLDEVRQFQSVIDPPCEETRRYRKGRGNAAQEQEIVTGDLKRGGPEEKMEQKKRK